MTKNPFRSINSIFKKAGNAVANTANKIFSKSNMRTFSGHVQDTLSSQGKILQTVGKIGTGLAVPLALGAAAFAPPLLPFIAGAGLASAGVGGMGLLEQSSANLLNPKLYKGKNNLQTTGAVVNQIERAGKGVANMTKFA